MGAVAELEGRPQPLCAALGSALPRVPEVNQAKCRLHKILDTSIHALLLPVLAYLLLLRLYGREWEPEQGATVYALKQRFSEEVLHEHLERTERKWQRKLEQARAAA